MGKYATQQISQFKELNKQIEARFTISKSVALTNERRQTHNMRNYQSEYDRVGNELSNSAIPFQNQEGIIKRTVELDQKWG